MKVLIVVTHLLGTGHLVRTRTLARAFLRAGHQVCVISGGRPVAHLEDAEIDQIQLPPLASDGVNFATLLDADGAIASPTLFADRKTQLLKTLSTFAPDVLITELFPFGRRVLRDEFNALLGAAHARKPRPLICASIRDILAPPSKPEKITKTEAILTRYYDAVLVHTDPKVTPLELSWPLSEPVSSRLVYTGFVAPPAPDRHPSEAGRGEVLVSVGGGAVGEPVLRAALAAARLTPDRTWRLLVRDPEALRKDAPPNVVLDPLRPDFRQMLHHADASISLCGYNTALDVLQTGVPAIFVPFDAGQEVEQGIRAQALSRLPGIAQIKTAELTAQSLRDALTTITSGPRRVPATEGFDGANQTVAHIERMMEQRP